MSDTELERLIVRIVGDGSSFQKMLSTAVSSSQEAASKVKQAADQIEQLGKSLKSYASTVVGALAGYGLASSFGGAFEKYADFERNQIRLNASIEASGQSVSAVLPKYKALADQITANSLASKGEVFGLIQKAQNIGKTGDALERVVKNSLAFGAATGQGAEAGFHLAQALETGNTHLLKHALLGRGAQVTDDELQKIINQRLASGFKIMGQEANTVSGQLEKLHKVFGGITLEVGKTVTEGMKPFVKILTQLADQFKALPDQTKQWITWIALGTLAFLGLGPAISSALFLLDVLGVNFIINTALQAANLIGWGLWAAAVWLAQGVLVVFNFFYGVFSTVLSLGTLVLIVQWAWWLASAAAVAGWTVVVLIAKGIAALFWLGLSAITTLWAVFTAGSLGAAASLAFWSLWAGVAKVASWLFNAALTVKNVLLAGVPLLIGLAVAAFAAFVAVLTVATGGVFALVAGLLTVATTVVVLTGAFLILGTPVLAVALTLKSLWDLFRDTPELKGPLGEISIILNNWFDILKSIWMAMQVDMPLAWQLAKASAKYFQLFLFDLWPPVWAFIQEGFSALWDLVKVSAVSNLKLAPLALVTGVVLAVQAIISVFEKLWPVLVDGFSKVADFIVEAIKAAWQGKKLDPRDWLPNVGDVAAQVAQIGKDIGELPEKEFAKQKEALETAQKRLADASKNLKAGLEAEASPEAQAAREEVERLRKIVAQREKEMKDKALNLGEGVGNNFGKGVTKGLDKLEPTLRHGAEAIARVKDYLDKLNPTDKLGRQIGNAGNNFPAGNAPIVVQPQVNNPVPGGAKLNAEPDGCKCLAKSEKLLEQIRDRLPANAAPLPQANIGA